MKALLAPLATLCFGVLAGCGSNSPAEAVVEPGITAIREASALACSSELGNLQLAIEAYTTLNVNPPTAESDLIPEWLRAESELYDLVDGMIVPVAGSRCPDPAADAAGAAPDTTPVLASPLSAECTARSKTLLVAVEAYHAMHGVGATPTEQVLLDAELLATADDAFDIAAGDRIVAVPGGTCDGVELLDETAPPGVDTLPVDGECEAQRKVLEIAIEAYIAASGSPPPTEADLVPDWLRSEISGYDIVDGVIVPAPGSTCPPA